MKEIQSFNAPKYTGPAYSPVEDDIYKTEGSRETIYGTSLSSIQEIE